VRLLNKATIDTGKKIASDPAFNLEAQLLAADLNVIAGAGTCPSAINAINDTQTLLAAIHFNGITHDKVTTAQAAQATSLATPSIGTTTTCSAERARVKERDAGQACTKACWTTKLLAE
jgi:hypothetical protein